jgi:hypothetical protein
VTGKAPLPLRLARFSITLNRHCDDAERSEGTKPFGDRGAAAGDPWDWFPAGQARGRRMTMARIDALLFPAFPCFRMIARRAAVKLRGQKSLVFHDIAQSATSCVQARRRQTSREIRMGLAGKEQGKNRGIAGGAGEPAKATRLRLYRRRPKAPPGSGAVEQKLPSRPRGPIQTN